MWVKKWRFTAHHHQQNFDNVDEYGSLESKSFKYQTKVIEKTEVRLLLPAQPPPKPDVPQPL